MNKTALKDMAVALIVIFILGWFLYLFFAAFINLLNHVQSDLVKAIIASATTVIVAAITIVAGKIFEQKQQIKQDLRSKKIPVYQKHIKTLFSVMFAEKRGEQPLSPQELAKVFSEACEEMIIWGSSDVIKAWGKFRTGDYAKDPALALSTLELILRAMRKDLGEDVIKLKQGELLRLFVNDLVLPQSEVK